MRRHACGALLFATLAGPAMAAPADFTVRYEAPTLSVRLERVPLDEVLAAVARETGMAIDGDPLDPREVSKHFDRVPLGRALRRLIGRQNFVLVYGADGSPRRLRLLGTPHALRRNVGSPQHRGWNAIRLFVAQPPLAVPARTARALGGSTVPMMRVLAALRNDDPFVRDECAAAIVARIQSSAALSSAIRDLDPGQLGRLVSSQAGPHAADAAARLYRAASDPALKNKFATMIAALHAAIG